MRRWKWILLSLAAAIGSHAGLAADVAVPAPLEPWRAWVLDQHRDLACPTRYASSDERECVWPGRLQLEADASGARFEQTWQLYSDGWITLPGETRYWPQDVLVDGHSVPVIERDNRAAIQLAAGEHHVQGTFRWDDLPTRLALPAGSGLLALTLHGRAVAQPTIDAAGNLLFGEHPDAATLAPATLADSLSVQVFRQLQDDIPLQLDTVVRFRVAGRDRELLLGQLLPDQFTPLAFDSPLPARIEADGRLRIQLRAGEWEVHLLARANGQPVTFANRQLDAVWPDEEIWSLQDNRSLRQITLTGAAGIDPSQTDMPVAWRERPAWLLHSGDSLTLTETRRGDPLVAGATAGDTLTLVRDLWLDFDGGGITSRDAISGALQQAARFSTATGQALGRAEVNGEPQLITHLDGQADEAGLELRPGPLQLLGLSRLTNLDSLTATGWQRDFNQVSGTLHLPPGWLLLHAKGVDSAAGAWLSRWNLWAIFLVLMVAAASWRLLGLAGGITALLAMLLSYHAAYAPVFLWLNALLAVALLRVIPAGRLQQAIRVYNGLAFVLLALLLLHFAVDQARRSLYPQLELGQNMTIRQALPATPVAMDAGASNQMTDEAAAAPSPASEMAMSVELAEKRLTGSDASLYGASAGTMPRKLKTGYDSNARIQTGPGEPTWQWQRVGLRWSGPVTQHQPLQLYLLSPGWHRVWNLAAVLLVFALAARLLRAAWPGLAGPRPATGTLPALLLALALLVQHTPVQAGPPPAGDSAAFPDQSLLDALEQRLTRPPACAPQCASLNRGLLQLDGDSLRVSLQIDTQASVAVPLPAQRPQWLPRSVLVDSEQAVTRSDDSGLLWVVLPAGSHRLLLEGPVAGDSLSLPFGMPVHNLTVASNGWHVAGLSEGRVPGGSLQLERTDKPAQPADNAAPALLPDPVSPFLRVTRTLVLGLDWQVHTLVERIAPATGVIALPVRLLPDEAVLTQGIDVHDGSVQVTMSSDTPSFSWYSSLKQGNTLSLTAASAAPWVEQWQFDIAPIWHVGFTGIPPVKQTLAPGQLPRWQPWPGETLTASISRPEAVSGSTRTIEAAVLDIHPGARAADNTLTLQVRSSQGGELPLGLPAGGQLQRVVIDGIEQGNPADMTSLRLPLRPGLQQVAISWRQDGGITWHSRTPQPRIEEPLSNIELRLALPRDRWLLAVGGPAMGPALLVWGVALVIALVACGLGRSRVAPLATWQWLLLGIGMSTVNSAGSLLVALWFVAMARRARLETSRLGVSELQAIQLGLVLLTLLALGCLVATIPLSLLSTPDMQVVGNQSTTGLLQWYQDRTTQGLPVAWAISLPMWVYRATMLAWSLWLVFSLPGWCRWGWLAFSHGEWWRQAPPRPPRAKRPAATAASPATTPAADSVAREDSPPV